MKTPNAKFITGWAQARNTNPDVAEAILYFAETLTDADRIWENASTPEMIAIWERVTKNGLLKASDFQWGQTTLQVIVDAEDMQVSS